MRSIAINEIYNLSKKNKKVIFIGSDLGPDTLKNFREKYPKRYFMEGVTESHIIGMAAGLASDGWQPFINTIGTFLTRRCFEQIVVDLGMHNLPVKLMGNGSGLVYAPLGHTHISTDDFGLFNNIPNMYVFSPCDENEMKSLMLQSLQIKSPCYFRLTKDGYPIITKKKVKVGEPSFIIREKNSRKLVISNGIITHNALAAIKSIKQKIDLLHFNTVQPINFKKLYKMIKNYEKIFVFEEHYFNTGMGAQISLNLKNMDFNVPIYVYGLPLKFFDEYGSQNEILKKYKLDKNGIKRKIQK